MSQKVIKGQKSVSTEYIQLIFTCSKSTIAILEKKCEVCSNLTIKTSEPRHWRRSGVFNVNFEHMAPFSSVSIVDFEQENNQIIDNKIIKLPVADKLFKYVWPFCGVGA